MLTNEKYEMAWNDKANWAEFLNVSVRKQKQSSFLRTHNIGIRGFM